MVNLWPRTGGGSESGRYADGTRKTDNERHAKNLQPMLPVYSGQIIGAVVKALNLDHPVLKERTARRFFAGRTVSEYSHAQILRAIGQVLVETGIVPVPSAFEKYGISMPNIVTETIARESQRWDKLVATMQSRSAATDDTASAIADFLRIVVVDLAVRMFALMRLAELDPGNSETPSWSQENGGGKYLRALTQQAGLTRDEMVRRIDVSDTSVDNWLDGNNRPTPENIAVIADAIADRLPGVEAQQIEQDIGRQFTFAHLADLVATQIGRQQTVELSSALTRFIRLITLDVEGMARPSIKEMGGDEIGALRFGAAEPWVHDVLLPNLAIAEPDPAWKEDILAAAAPWDVSFQHVGAKNTQLRSAAGLAQDTSDIAGGEDPARFQIYNRLSRTMFEPLKSGVAIRRAIAHDFPSSPTAHLELGSFLGMAGKWMGRRDLVDEGITECKIASGLLPDWDNPAVEPGIILANIRAYDEALVELAHAAERLPVATPHLRFATGYVLMELSRHTEALEHFESVIASRPDYALAHGYAARCAFELGGTTKAIGFAKTARRLGEPTEYNAWRKRRKKSRVASSS